MAPLRGAGSVKQAAFSSKGTHKPLKILGSFGVGVEVMESDLHI